MLYLDTLTLQMWPEVIKFKQDLLYLNRDLTCLNIDLPCLKQDLSYLKQQELLQVFTAFPHRLCLKKLPPAAGGNLLKVGFADVNPGIPGVTPMIIDGVGAPGVVVEDPGTAEVAAEKESSKFKFIWYVIVFHFQYNYSFTHKGSSGTLTCVYMSILGLHKLSKVNVF